MSRRIALLVLAAAPAVLAPGLGRSIPVRADAAADARAAAVVELGRRLFFDPAVGRRGEVGCSSCHEPEHGFSDHRAVSVDETGPLPRRSQPLTDLVGEGFHWDGEFDTVRDVVDARVLPAAESLAKSVSRSLRRVRDAKSPDPEALRALVQSSGVVSEYYAANDPTRDPGATTIAERISRGRLYDRGFEAAFGEAKATSDRVAAALAAYVASLRATAAPIDSYLAGDRLAISETARRGLDLFRGKAGCAACHTADGPRPIFTDGKFHVTGVESRRVRDQPGVTPHAGRVSATFAPEDRRAFKTPGLRDVARRAPYFHDASGRTLAEVVRYYNDGATPDAHLDARLHPLGLTDAEAADLVAFLESLTGRERPGLGAAGGIRSPKLTIRVENLDGSGAGGVRIAVRPFGDRLAGASAMPKPFYAVTDANGDAVVAMPLSTHVLLDAPGVASSPPLPDWTPSWRFIRSPSDKITLRVRFWDGSKAPAEMPVRADLSRSGDLVFRKVRDLDALEAMYAIDAIPDLRGLASCVPALPRMIEAGPRFGLDLTPGAGNRLDIYERRGTTGSAALATANSDAAEIRRIASDALGGR